jgi:hypothetical protein
VGGVGVKGGIRTPVIRGVPHASDSCLWSEDAELISKCQLKGSIIKHSDLPPTFSMGSSSRKS